MSKVLLAIAAMLAIVGLKVDLAAETPAINVYVLAGQSNACGAGSSLGDFQPDFSDNKIFYSYKMLHNIVANDPGVSGNWTESVGIEKMHAVHAGQIGPELYLGRRLFYLREGGPLAIVKVCAGSSKMLEHWHGPNGLFAKHLLPKLQEALRGLRQKGYQPNLAGFAWVQGESDAYNADTDLYSSAFLGMISFLRQVYSPNMQFVIARTFGGEMIDLSNTNYIDLRSHQVQLAACDPLGAWVSADDLELTDAIHFNYESQVKLGRRLAEMLLRMPGTARNVSLPYQSNLCSPFYHVNWIESLRDWRSAVNAAQGASRSQVVARNESLCRSLYHHYKWYLPNISMTSCNFDN